MSADPHHTGGDRYRSPGGELQQLRANLHSIQRHEQASKRYNAAEQVHDDMNTPLRYSTGPAAASEHTSPLLSSAGKANLSTLTATNSRAVLAALKSLQEKIRRLEQERADNAGRCDQLQQQLRKQADDHEMLLQREKTESSKREHELRKECEMLELQKDKALDKASEIMQRMQLADEQLLQVRAELEQRQADREAANARSLDVETRLQSATKDFNERIRDLQSTIDEKDTRLRHATSLLEKANEELELYKEERKRRITLEQENAKLEQALSDVLQINETLVGTKQQRTKKRVASKSKSTRRSKSVSSRKSSSQTSSKRRSLSAEVSSRKQSTSRSKHASLQDRVTAANLRQVPFVVGAAKADATSHSLTAAIQRHLTYKESVGTRRPSADRVPKKRPTSKKSRKPESGSTEMVRVYGTNRSETDSTSGTPRESSEDFDEELIEMAGEAKKVRNALLRTPPRNASQLRSVVAELEDELAELNQVYHDLLLRARSVSELTGDDEGVTRQLRNVIDEMEKKRNQISTVKTYKAKMTQKLKDAVSPNVPGAEKRAKTLRLLHEIRTLEGQ